MRYLCIVKISSIGAGKARLKWIVDRLVDDWVRCEISL